MMRDSYIHRKKVTKEHDVTQKILSRILMLHESGIPPEAIRLNLYETCQVKVSLRLINRAVGKMELFPGYFG
jgi:hypothetical protein